MLTGFSFGQSACLSSLFDHSFAGPTNGVTIEKGDFDNDGILDLVIANFTIGTLKINVMKGNGDATFDPPSLVEGGTRPSALRAGDFNGDGDLDLLVANFSPANVSVLMGNGDGTFQAAVNYTPNTGPRSIDIGDFNGDSAIDFVVGTNSGGFNIFLNQPALLGTFTGGTYFSMAAATYGIRVADLNNDGFKDVATANEGGGNVSVRFGNGAGSFGAVTNYSTGSSCYELGTGDFNADGLIDIAASNRLGNTVSVLLNTGAGVYATAVNYPCGESPYGLDLGDLDNDGKLDIAVVNGLTNTLSVFKGQTGGTFAAHVQSNLVGNPRDLIIGNFNGDANLDIAVSTFIGQVMPVYVGTGSLSFPDSRTILSSGAPYGIATADMNGDSNNDILIANSTSNQMTLHLGNGAGGFGAGTSFAVGSGPKTVVVGDVNNNGILDAVTVNETAGTISVLLGNGSGSFPTITSFGCNASPNNISLEDINNDGNLDVLVTNAANQFSVLLGNGAGSFGSPTAYTTGAGPTSIVVKNLNGDTFKDVAVTNGGTNTISVFMNSGSGTFGSAATYTVQTAPSDIDAGDIDNDGDLDLVVSNFTSSNFSRLLNNGSGTFSTAANTNLTAGEASSIQLGDFNLDNNLDVLVAFRISNVSTGIVGLFLGNGAGSFTFYEKFSTGLGPRQLVLGNLNNDSRIDAVVVNESANTFTVLLNNTALISASGPLTFCVGGSVDLTSTPSTIYDWNPSGSAQTINVTTSGTYNVTTSQGPSFWCESTSNSLTVVNSSPPAPTITASGPTTLCAGGTVTLTSSYPTNNVWSNGLTTQSITVSATGDYSVVYNPGGCPSDTSLPVNVIVNTTPIISASGPTTFCTGGSVVLTSSIDSPIIWSNAATTENITVTSSGTYTVSTNFPSCPALTSLPVTITVNTYPPTPTITASGPTTFCNGNSVTLTSSAPSNNVWSNLTTNNTLVANASNSYSVTVNNAGCISAPSNTIVVTVNPNPSPATITNGATDSYCDGGSLVLSSSLPNNNSWSTLEGTQSITATSPGTYTLTQVNGFGCSSTPASIVVTENSLPNAPTVSASGPLTFCSGNNVVLSSSYATNNLWTPSGNTQNITVSNSGTYTVQHTDANGCVSPSSTPINVVVNGLPAAPIINPLGPVSFCPGGSVSLQSNQPTGNNWSNFAPGQTITATNPGNYSATFTDGNGCVSPVSNVITVSLLATPATPVISASGPTSFCTGESVDLTSSETSGILWSTSATTPTINVSTSNIITVTKTGVNGCTSTSLPVTVTVSNPPAVPTISPGGPLTFCAGGSVPLTSSALGNTWSNGLSGQTINVTTAGDYYVFANVNGCLSASSDTITVIVNPLPSVPIISANGPTEFCEGDSVQLTSSQNNTESWSNGLNGQSIWVSEGGNITVTSTEAGGCFSTSLPVTITVNPSPIVTVQNDPIICLTAPVSAMTYASPAGGNYAGSGVIANLFFPQMAGLGTHPYTYSITNSLGCTGTGTGNVIVDNCNSIDEVSIDFVKLFPNPTTGTFYVTSDIFEFNQLFIYNNAGKLVYSEKFENTTNRTVDEANIADGIYHVLIKNEDEITYRFPIAIQN